MTGIAALTMTRTGPLFISGSTTASDSGPASTISASAPTSYQANDLLLAIGWANNAGSGVNWNTISLAYTEILDQGATPSLGLQYKTSTNGSDGAYTLTSGSNFANYGYAVELAFRYAQYDTVGSVATLTSDGNLVIPAITSAGGVVYAVVVTDQAFTVSTPSGWTLVAGSNANRWKVFSKTCLPGTTGTLTVAISGISGTVAGVLVGLK